MAPLERADLGWRRDSLLAAAPRPLLEIGAGTGANLIRYSSENTLIASEPERAMLDRYRKRHGQNRQYPLLLQSRAEAIPFSDATFRTVVSTLVLCSVMRPETALGEIYRVLRPGGKLIFIEHVRGEGRRGRWQDRLAPIWSRLGGGCHPNRQTLTLMERAGFTMERVEAFDPSDAASWLVRMACRPVLPFVCGKARRVAS